MESTSNRPAGRREPRRQPATFDDDAARAALAAGFAECEQGLLASSCTSGAAAAVICLQAGGSALNVAWCGGCRAVLSRGGQAIALTTDHTCRSSTERARIEQAGASVVQGKLGGQLHVTRALGGLVRQGPTDAAATPMDDADEGLVAGGAQLGGAPAVKPVGLSAEPELASVPLCAEDEFVIIASDGLWKVRAAAPLSPPTVPPAPLLRSSSARRR